jgi:hypothetical protein
VQARGGVQALNVAGGDQVKVGTPEDTAFFSLEVIFGAL